MLLYQLKKVIFLFNYYSLYTTKMISEEDTQKIDKMYNTFKDNIYDILKEVINALNITQNEKNSILIDIFPPTCELFKTFAVAHFTGLSLINNTYKIDMDKKDKEIESLNNKLQENHAFVNKLKNMMDTTRNFTDAKIAENKKLEATVKEQIDKNNILEAIIIELNAIIKEHDKSIQNVQNYNTYLKNEIELIQISCDNKYEQKNQYLNKQINERDRELNLIHKENTKLQKEAEKNLNETNKLKSDINSQNVQIIQIQTQCQQQIKKEQTQLEEMTKDITNLKECINKLSTENSNKNRINNELRAEKNNLLKKITEFETNNIILTKENDELKTKLNKIDYGEGALARLFNRLAKDKFVYQMHFDINMTRINVEICK